MANTWMSDSALAEQLGDGWVDDTEISLSAVNSEGTRRQRYSSPIPGWSVKAHT
jgi:hypothetical protein